MTVFKTVNGMVHKIATIFTELKEKSAEKDYARGSVCAIFTIDKI